MTLKMFVTLRPPRSITIMAFHIKIDRFIVRAISMNESLSRTDYLRIPFRLCVIVAKFLFFPPGFFRIANTNIGRKFTWWWSRRNWPNGKTRGRWEGRGSGFRSTTLWHSSRCINPFSAIISSNWGVLERVRLLRLSIRISWQIEFDIFFHAQARTCIMNMYYILHIKLIS